MHYLGTLEVLPEYLRYPDIYLDSWYDPSGLVGTVVGTLVAWISECGGNPGAVEDSGFLCKWRWVAGPSSDWPK